MEARFSKFLPIRIEKIRKRLLIFQLFSFSQISFYSQPHFFFSFFAIYLSLLFSFYSSKNLCQEPEVRFELTPNPVYKTGALTTELLRQVIYFSLIFLSLPNNCHFPSISFFEIFLVIFEANR